MSRAGCALLGVLALCGLLCPPYAHAAGRPRAAERGRKAFARKCAACHGEQGHGDGVHARALYRLFKVAPRELADPRFQKARTDAALFLAISRGGAFVRKSRFMPPWEHRLDRQARRDLVAYVRTLAGGTRRAPRAAPAATLDLGRGVFEANCAQCHGLKGHAFGPVIAQLCQEKPTQQKPPDFTDARYVRTLSDAYLFRIIQKGGREVGRSPTMPEWRKKLTPVQIEAVIAYLRTMSRRIGDGDPVTATSASGHTRRGPRGRSRR